MDFKQLQYMTKVAECGNITRAAEQLYISQPALSSFISKTEDELGAKIFNRSTTPLTLTTAGEYYIKTAHSILSLKERLEKDIDNLNRSKESILRIGLSDMRATALLPFVLPDFRRMYPHVRLSTIESTSTRVEENVREGRVDMGIIPLYQVSPGFAVRRVYREEMLLVSPRELPNHPDGLRQWVEPDVLENQPFIMMAAPARQRLYVQDFFREHNIHPGSIIDSSNHMTTYLLASNGMGMAIVPEALTHVMNPVHIPRIYRLGCTGLSWDIAAIWPEDAPLAAAGEQLIQIIMRRFS